MRVSQLHLWLTENSPENYVLQIPQFNSFQVFRIMPVPGDPIETAVKLPVYPPIRSCALTSGSLFFCRAPLFCTVDRHAQQIWKKEGKYPCRNNVDGDFQNMAVD